MRRLAMALSLLFLVACSSPPSSSLPPPDHAAAPSKKPAPQVSSTVGCTEVPAGELYGALYGGPTPQYVEVGRCARLIDSDLTHLTFRLPPSLSDADALGSLRVTGPAEAVHNLIRRSDELALQIDLPPGWPGERYQVHLALPGRAPFGFDLERVETPRISVEVRQGNRPWQPLFSSATLLAEPLQLRFTSTPGLPLAEIEKRLAERSGFPVVRLDAQRLLITIAQPPNHLLIDLNGIRNQVGFESRRSLWELYTGAPPLLVALDPATGQERPLGEVPANVSATYPAADGRFVAMVAVDPNSLDQERVWVFDTLAGTLHATPLRPSWPRAYIHWSPDGLIVALGARVQRWDPTTAQSSTVQSEGGQFTALSPDGRYLAGIRYDMTREDANFLAPATIVLHEIATGEDRLVAAGQIRVRIPHSEVPPTLPLRFTPDGAALLIDEPIPRTAQNDNWPYRRLQLDLATESLKELPEAGPAPVLAWVEGPGGYAYRWQGWYAPILLRAADGPEQGYGTGLVVGWDPAGHLLLIRWPNAAEMRHFSLGL